MSDVAIFAAGSVIFVITAWATIAYGLAAAHQLRVRDLESSPSVAAIKPESQFTDIYVRTDEEDGEESPSSVPAAGPVGEHG